MPKLCCFIDPKPSAEDRSLSDRCPDCGRPFGFPLINMPRAIGNYRVMEALDRGFYSVTYVAEVGPFQRKRVLKVVPSKLYEAFSKDFEAECSEHAKAAEASQHIIDIHDMKLNVPIQFNDIELVCHVAEMDYVNGRTLQQCLVGEGHVSSNTVAQIAIDLFSLLGELESKQVRHNDLHAGNLILENLSESARRADAEEPLIRLVAIDLNSAADESKSDPEEQRYGDLHWAVKHLGSLADKLLSKPDGVSDIDYRLASVIEERAHLLSPVATSQRAPTFDECIEDIRTAVRQVSSPWTEKPRLRRFNDAYNAQTLAPWFVPYLLVDPDERWLAAISVRGPQVITGMRGSGKTMLLRALQFHARATYYAAQNSVRGNKGLANDGYIGLYASCTRLLDNLAKPTARFHEPFARLFVHYAVEALRAMRHLRELDDRTIRPSGFREIGNAVSAFVEGGEDAKTAATEFELERVLLNISVRLSRGDRKYFMTANPAEVFPYLARAIVSCSDVWNKNMVFFLLDDVSTRFLREPNIQSLMSSLLFADPACAFKLTTEAQTLELILRSPGQIERARAGRDYDVFDLGTEVNELTGTRKGVAFVEDILARRAEHYEFHPRDVRPSAILGDTTLESIASRIAQTAETSAERKRVYHGISALARVCVGDIGDVISIYELILRRASSNEYPVSPNLQSECFQDFCSRRLYDLNRRSSILKDHALAFAEASHELLMQSYKKAKVKGDEKLRLRQYLKVYVRLTKGETEKQYDQIRELIDAGVFVLNGGTHRTKTRDSDPIQQFKLAFRKLYGLSNFIGLAERDRFELSGEDLMEWLFNPKNGKEILLRNLGGLEEVPEHISDDLVEDSEGSDDMGSVQCSLFDVIRPSSLPEKPTTSQAAADDHRKEALITSKVPHCRPVSDEVLRGIPVDVLVLGLGFEGRTMESIRRILEVTRPTRAVAVQYKEEGKSREIYEALSGCDVPVDMIDYEAVVEHGLSVAPGRTLVDITGLAKPALFHAVRWSLNSEGSVLVCHTKAEVHYPKNEDIAPILKAAEDRDYYTLLDALSGVLTGEEGPYSIDALMDSDADDSRRRALCAFSSPKHERLLSLLDERQYDRIELITHDDTTPRAQLANVFADFVQQNYPSTNVEALDTDDLVGVHTHLTAMHHRWYVQEGMNFEIGLTGSKLQAVACAALAAAVKVSQCWYVRPKEFDVTRFTQGTGATRYFEISLAKGHG